MAAWAALLLASCLPGFASAETEPGKAPAKSVAGPYFEIEDAAGLDFTYDNAVSGSYYMPEITCGGVALFDADGDGDLDVFFVQGAPWPDVGEGGANQAEVREGEESGAGDGARAGGGARGEAESGGDGSGGEGGKAPAVSAPSAPRATSAGIAAAAPRTVAGAPFSDRLFRNDLERDAEGRPRLAFTDISEEAGIGDAAYGCGVAAGDYDADGDVDLYVANLGENRLLRNRGDGHFEDVTAAAGAGDDRWTASALFTDYDADGDLDLLLVNYVVFDPARQKACRTASGAPDYCNPAAFAGVPNRLLENRGDGTFRDVSAASGVGAARGKSLGAVAGDFDGDGDIDLYVTNDGEANELWSQGDGDEAGRFEDVALFRGAAVDGRGRAQASMGVVTADHDGDGDLDLFLTHLDNETHTLYRNDGAGGFRDASTAAGLGAPTLPYTGWGVAWADVDLDGRLDLVVVHGAVRALAERAAAGESYPFQQADALYLQRRDGAPGRYTPAAPPEPALVGATVSRGLAAGDLDDDGDPDLVVVDLGTPARLLLNRARETAYEGEGAAAGEHHWLGLRLLWQPASDSAPWVDALGARAELLDGDGTPVAIRRAATDGSFASAGDPRVVFGLGEAAGERTVRVLWPDGHRELFRGVPTDRYTTLRRGSGEKDLP